MLNKMASSEFRSGNFGKTISVGGGLSALQFFWSLKKGIRTFNYSQNEPSCDILGPLDRYDHPWGKNKTKKLFWYQNSIFRVSVTIEPGCFLLQFVTTNCLTVRGGGRRQLPNSF